MSRSRADIRRVFIDTGAMIALTDPRDPYHEAAVAFRKRLSGMMLTTTLILAEFYSFLLYKHGREAAKACSTS